jgi:hypothetical protein
MQPSHSAPKALQLHEHVSPSGHELEADDPSGHVTEQVPAFKGGVDLGVVFFDLVNMQPSHSAPHELQLHEQVSPSGHEFEADEPSGHVTEQVPALRGGVGFELIFLSSLNMHPSHSAPKALQLHEHVSPSGHELEADEPSGHVTEQVPAFKGGVV